MPKMDTCIEELTHSDNSHRDSFLIRLGLRPRRPDTRKTRLAPTNDVVTTTHPCAIASAKGTGVVRRWTCVMVGEVPVGAT